MAVDDQFPYRLYAGQQDNSSISVPSRLPPGMASNFEAEFQVKRREARAAAEGKKGMTVKSEPIEEDHDQDRS